MTVAAIDRCLTLLELLAGAAEPVELTELAARLGEAPSAAHRALATLVQRGWVVQDPGNQRYALSLRMSTLAFRNLDARAVPDVVQSVLDRLAATTREHCRLAIVEGEDLVWVARAQGAVSGLRYDPDMGQEIILHATANGKAWLSTLPEAKALEIALTRGRETRRTLGPHAAADVDRLRAALNLAREKGYAVIVSEAEAGIAAMARPFFASDLPGAPVAGTVSVAGPELRIHPDRYEELAAALKVAADELSTLWPLRARQRRERPSETMVERAGEGLA